MSRYKKIPFIVSFLAFICVPIATFIIIPLMLLGKDNLEITYVNFKVLYINSELMSSILKDYEISVLFSFLGINAVISSIKRQLINSNYNEKKIKIVNQNSNIYQEQISEYFIEHNALNEDNAIDIDLKNNNIDEKTFKLMIQQEIIIRKKELYYYDEKVVKRNNLKRNIVYLL